MGFLTPPITPFLLPHIHTHSLMLQIRSLGGLDWLLLSWHSEAARVSLLRPTWSAQQQQYRDGKFWVM